jgi:hypothetical protein
MQQLIGNSCRLGILTYPLVSSIFKCIGIVKQVRSIVFVNGGLAYLQAVSMPLVIDSKDVD